MAWTWNLDSIMVSTTGAMRHFDNTPDLAGNRAHGGFDPLGQIPQALPAMRERAFAAQFAFGVDQRNLMVGRSPVDSHGVPIVVPNLLSVSVEPPRRLPIPVLVF